MIVSILAASDLSWTLPPLDPLGQVRSDASDLSAIARPIYLIQYTFSSRANLFAIVL